MKQKVILLSIMVLIGVIAAIAISVTTRSLPAAGSDDGSTLFTSAESQNSSAEKPDDPSVEVSASAVSPDSESSAEDMRYKPGEFLLVMEEGADRERLERELAAISMEAEVLAENTLLVKIPMEKSVPEAIEEAEALAGVLYAQPNFIYQTMLAGGKT